MLEPQAKLKGELLSTEDGIVQLRARMIAAVVPLQRIVSSTKVPAYVIIKTWYPVIGDPLFGGAYQVKITLSGVKVVEGTAGLSGI